MLIIWPTLPLFLSISIMSCTSSGKVRTCFLILAIFFKPKSCWNCCFYLFWLAFIHIQSLNYCFQKQHLYSYNGFRFLSFQWKFLANIPVFFLCFPPNFIAPASPHTLSNPLSLRLCICPSLSIPVTPFCSPGLCRLTHYLLPDIFIARWWIQTFTYLWLLFISSLSPPSNLAVSLISWILHCRPIPQSRGAKSIYLLLVGLQMFQQESKDGFWRFTLLHCTINASIFAVYDFCFPTAYSRWARRWLAPGSA